jgi:hypothetical protein
MTRLTKALIVTSVFFLSCGGRSAAPQDAGLADSLTDHAVDAMPPADVLPPIAQCRLTCGGCCSIYSPSAVRCVKKTTDSMCGSQGEDCQTCGETASCVAGYCVED